MALEYQALLYPRANEGYAWCPKKKRFYISYQVTKNGEDPTLEREWIDVSSHEEAKAERDRRYTELLLAGAKYKGLTPIFKKTFDRGLPQPNIGPDEGLIAETVEVVKWKVYCKGTYVGYSFDKTEARKMRDAYMKQWNIDNMFKPCAVCGEKPRFIAHFGIGHEHQRDVTHDTPGCPNHVLLSTRHMNQGDKVAAWNEFFCTGTFGMTGKIPFAAFRKKVEAFRTQEKKGAKRMLREYQKQYREKRKELGVRKPRSKPTKEQPHWYQGKPDITRIAPSVKEKLDIPNKKEE